MADPSNIPNGRYSQLDDGSRSGQVLYGEDDQPQSVGRGIATTDGAAAVVLSGGRNIRSVAIVGTDILVTLMNPQANAGYIVNAGQEALGNPRNVIVSLKTTTTFTIGMATEAGVAVDMAAEARILTFDVMKAL